MADNNKNNDEKSKASEQEVEDVTDDTGDEVDDQDEAEVEADTGDEVEAEAGDEADDQDQDEDEDEGEAEGEDAGGDPERLGAKPKAKARSKSKKGGRKTKAKVKQPKKKPSPADEPDEFIAGVNRWATALRPHAIKIAATVGLVAVLLIGWAVYSWLGQRTAAKWTATYVEVVSLTGQPIVDSDAGPGDPGTFKSEKARAEAVLSASEKVAGSGGVSSATELLRARQLMVLERYDDAIGAFGEVARSDLPGPVKLSAREGIGYAHEAKAEATEDVAARKQALEAALKAFEDMQPAEDGQRRDWSMYHQARVLATLGRGAEAKTLYEKILTTQPNSELKPQIEVRLIALGGDE